MSLGCERHAPATTPSVKIAVTNFTEGRLDPAQVWTGAENLASTVIRYPDRPTLSESLYQLSYPGLISIVLLLLMNFFLVSSVTPENYGRELANSSRDLFSMSYVLQLIAMLSCKYLY